MGLDVPATGRQESSVVTVDPRYNACTETFRSNLRRSKLRSAIACCCCFLMLSVVGCFSTSTRYTLGRRLQVSIGNAGTTNRCRHVRRQAQRATPCELLSITFCEEHCNCPFTGSQWDRGCKYLSAMHANQTSFRVCKDRTRKRESNCG